MFSSPCSSLSLCLCLSLSLSNCVLYCTKSSNKHNRAAKAKHEACVSSLLWLCLDIMHCFRRGRESLLGIKSKLWHWVGTELLGITLSTGMFARRAVSLDFPLSAKWLLRCQNPWCAWCQRKVNSHIPCRRTSLGTALSASSGSLPADTSSQPQQGVSLAAADIASTPHLSSHP